MGHCLGHHGHNIRVLFGDVLEVPAKDPHAEAGAVPLRMQLHPLPVVLKLAHERTLPHLVEHRIERTGDTAEHRRNRRADGKRDIGAETVDPVVEQCARNVVHVGVSGVCLAHGAFRTPQLGQQGKPLGIIACFSWCCIRKHTASVPCPDHAGCCVCTLQILSEAESACKGNKDREPHCVDTQVRTPCAYEVSALLAAACTEHARGKALLRLQGALPSRPCNTVQRSKHLGHGERLAAHKLRHVLASLERHVARIPGLVPQLTQYGRRASRYLRNDAVDRRATETELDALVRRRNLPAHQVDGGCHAVRVVVADDA